LIFEQGRIGEEIIPTVPAATVEIGQALADCVESWTERLPARRRTRQNPGVPRLDCPRYRLESMLEAVLSPKSATLGI
jgi:hypothetical protein